MRKKLTTREFIKKAKVAHGDKYDYSLSEYIDSKTAICKDILSIRQVYNFCKKIQAKLVILGTMYDFDNNYLHYDVPCFEQIMTWPITLVDKGDDGLHPGPEQHKIYAEKFIELFQKYYKDKSL